MTVLRLAKQYKDRLFKFLFGNPEYKELTLALYNSLNNSDYLNANDLQIVTLEESIYINMKNDVSFLLRKELYMFEQQSTWNPNIPFRMLEYVVQQYGKLLDSARSKYSSKMLEIPAPNFILFYNGSEDISVAKLKLSDIYVGKSKRGLLDLEVEVINLQPEKNPTLEQWCKPLYEYSWVVEIMREYIKENKKDTVTTELVGEALNHALQQMPDNFAIKPILEKKKEEVIPMIFQEFNESEYQRIQEEDKQKDIADAEAKGDAKGQSKEKIATVKRMLKLGLSLDVIQQSTELSEKEILEIKQNS